MMKEILDYLFYSVFIMPFLLGIIFSATAIITLKFPPRKINSFYGYRTPSSMRNQQVWDFAQRFSSEKMLQSGLFSLLFAFTGILIPHDEKVQTIIGFSLLILIVFYLFWSTESAIKKKFPNT